MSKSVKKTKRTWTKPETECLESRAEVSAYAGTGTPWPRTR
jgi:hypothetical protein